MSKLCKFYIEVKDLRDDESKVFTCGCRRHKGQDISVVKIDGAVREIVQRAAIEPKKEEEQ